MALTVRPDDEVYQFDTVWLGPDEYTLPIQARYVAWGTWLACFLVAAAVLIPVGGHGPGGVLGSLMWSVAVSVVAARAVMLIVDHERPLRSLPKLFSAEARAALAASRGGERSIMLKANRVRVREMPEKVLRRRDRDRRAAERRAERRTKHGRRGRAGQQTAGAELAVPAQPPAERAGPAWTGTVLPYQDWDESALTDQPWVAAQEIPAGYEMAPAQPSYSAYSDYSSYPSYADYTEDGDDADAARPYVTVSPGDPSPAPPPPAPAVVDVDGRILLPARRVP